MILATKVSYNGLLCTDLADEFRGMFQVRLSIML